MSGSLDFFFFFFFNDTATTEIYTLSLHDALPIFDRHSACDVPPSPGGPRFAKRSSLVGKPYRGDRKSTRLNSSHLGISYAVFCLKKKKMIDTRPLIAAIVAGKSSDKPCVPHRESY